MGVRLMVPSPIVWDTRRTGRTRHRETFFGKMVLQVEIAHQRVRLDAPGHDVAVGDVQTTWRDATYDEWQELGIP